ncbi:metallopeptidase [Schizosaccharomyces japonicus yFS275]|uniref:Metallopeptidase n=1 Tax=Schizosaccharomyces japonicus (strain yFS275 / FY16936) TaxID=402676 RepID=B6K454_SCHJY|nr:metallopeptidase [Schizosaccharomyces japonicus yFS275]EEB08261.1 metallopeptidase [Schizosaccharomyces japonicus yFS275]
MQQILFDNIKTGETVYHRFVLVRGRVSVERDGCITVTHNQGSFPSQSWPVNGGFYKALVHVEPGENDIEFCFNESNGNVTTKQSLKLHYQRLTNNPVVQLAFMLGRDSPATFDCPQSMKNDLDEAMRKLRCAAYLWQAFTADCMYRNGFGRRTFQLAETVQPDTLSCMSPWGTQRLTATVNVFRADKTAEEIRSVPDDDLFGIAMDTLHKNNVPQPFWFACMFLDTRYDSSSGKIRGHVALGGGAGDSHLGVFGSHSLHSFPSAIEYVVPTFSDDRLVPKYLANDANESSTVWECANIGIGAMLHEVGHSLGCPHQPDGIMLRSYTVFNRTFTTQEFKCVRTGSTGLKPVLEKDECSWHRLDMLRFLYHPSFRLPNDPVFDTNGDLTITPLKERIQVSCASGIYLLEVEYDNLTRGWKEFNPPQTMIAFSDRELREMSNAGDRAYKVRILSCNNKCEELNDISKTLSDAIAETPYGSMHKSQTFGLKGTGGQELPSLLIPPETHITHIRVYSGMALDGIELTLSNGQSLMFGNRGGSPKDVPFSGSRIVGFKIRSGAWVDGIGFIFENGNESPFYGNEQGGGSRNFLLPINSVFSGFFGSAGPFCDSIGFYYQ